MLSVAFAPPIHPDPCNQKTIHSAMTISNELSSEIATAILAGENKAPQELKELMEIVIKVHSVLQEMKAEARAARHHSKFNPKRDQTTH
jgi:hypothetical protein